MRPPGRRGGGDRSRRRGRGRRAASSAALRARKGASRRSTSGMSSACVQSAKPLRQTRTDARLALLQDGLHQLAEGDRAPPLVALRVEPALARHLLPAGNGAGLLGELPVGTRGAHHDLGLGGPPDVLAERAVGQERHLVVVHGDGAARVGPAVHVKDAGRHLVRPRRGRENGQAERRLGDLDGAGLGAAARPRRTRRGRTRPRARPR